MALQLTLRDIPPVPLEVERLLPTLFQQTPRTDWPHLEVYLGKERYPLAEWFELEGDVDDATLIWQGDLSRVHWIGAGMDSGRIEIHGDAGRHVGSEMTGGTIIVRGNAGNHVGAEMKGGRIVVHGSAGHLVGGAYRGSPVGMRGGEILIHGSAGNEVGHSMRRGIIAVAGDVADLAGFAMRAGTIVIGGQAGIRHGAEMIRGSLVYLSDVSVLLLPTVRAGAVQQPVILRLIARYLAQLDFPLDAAWGDRLYRIHHGDLLAGGRGEYWIPLT